MSTEQPSRLRPAEPGCVVEQLQVEVIGFARSLHLLKQTHQQQGTGVTPAIPLLARLELNGPMRSRHLAEHFGLDPSTVSRHVEQLAKSGLVRRTVDPDDGRALLLEVTPQGEQAVEHHRQMIVSTLHLILQDWSETDKQALATLLHRLNADTASCLPSLLERSRHRVELQPESTTTSGDIA